jgi:hypothetical protein
MPIITVTDKDILRGKVVTPGWYRVKVDAVGEALASSGKTTNYPVEGTIVKNSDDGSTDFAGVPTPPTWMFNSGYISKAEGFIVSLGGQWNAGRIDLGAAAGKEIDVFIENELYQGSMVNRINHKYRPVR